jgi:outer membrane protein, heavy metal efflux system
MSLSDLVAEIAASNPELHFYENEIAAARAHARGAAAWPEPELAVELGRKRVRGGLGEAAREGTAWSVSVQQTFEWPGRMALRKAIANREVELAELGLERFRRALATRAQLLAYGLHAAQTKAAALREVAARFAALEATLLARDPAGVTPLLETRVIEASELVLQRRATAAALGLQTALIELNQLRGVDPAMPVRVSIAPLRLNDAPSTETLLAAARQQHFDFRMRQVELAQAESEVRLARRERYPAVAVSPFYSEENADERETIVGLGLSLPLPVTSRARSAIAAADARRRQAEVARTVAERELAREVLTSAQVYAAKVAETRSWAPDTVGRFREAAELADRHYRLGAVPVATYVELQTSYVDAVEALLDTEIEALEAGLRLQQLTGIALNESGVER